MGCTVQFKFKIGDRAFVTEQANTTAGVVNSLQLDSFGLKSAFLTWKSQGYEPGTGWYDERVLSPIQNDETEKA